MSISPCDLPLDIFYKLIEDYNDPSKALELIEICDRMEDFMSDSIRRKQFLKYYRHIIKDLEYNDLISLFDNNQELFDIMRNDPQFWKEMINKISPEEFLIYSSSQGHTEFVSKFIEYNFPASSESFCEALYGAIKNGHLGIVKLIINIKKVSLYSCDQSIFIASEYGHADIVKFLLENRKFIKHDIKHASHDAAKNGHVNVIELLMNHPKFPSALTFALFLAAIENNRIELVDFFLNIVDIIPGYIIMIMYSISPENTDMFNLLLENDQILSSLNNYKEKDWMKEKLTNLIKNEGSDKYSGDFQKLVEVYTKLRKEKPPLPDYLKSKKQKDLYKYWKSQLSERQYALNKYYLRDDADEFLPSRWEISIIIKGSLNDFLKKYKMEIRGILQVQEKEMRVIFQAYPDSAVSIVHIKEL